ncbi:putative mannosyl-oligosaccharide alpha-1,2-mannosidase 1B [Grifola frondosa]|uniref:alpha-1,2-Mannosidase n=1 Tax=Grifola frondosa TaxID=5627 RepID=A0A1C7LSN4_GRIFR|nr:putative mannosyl-oligosaccharide alpha-1,2-mannosidase 1B [Grifola frondosa]
MGTRRMWSLLLALACSWDISSVLGAGIVVQDPSLKLPSDAAENRQAVTNLFLTSWNAYKEYAFPHDDLTPVSISYTDGRNGWGASVVDAMTTMFIMGQTELFEEAVNFTSHIDFTISHTTDTVSIFETTIRYLAGMLSAYELSGNKYPALIQQATTLADKLSTAWVGNNAVPFGELDYNISVPQIATSNVAEAGTLDLEWSRLAIYTGNDTFRRLAENSVRLIANLSDPIPGMPAQGIDPSTGESVGAYVTWGGGTDSYLEYLIKYARLTNTNDTLFADTWATAVDSSIRILARTSTVGDHLYLADLDDTGTIVHIGSHLECYFAGNWLLGGKLLKNETIINFALQANDACWNTYASTATGIGPEAFGYFSSDGNYTGSSPGPGDIAFYERNGFFILPGSTYYYMRPEVLESNFYAWRITGDTKYYERAASAVSSFATYLKAPVAFAPIDDVDSTDSDFIDDMESFWFAEVMKYLYLTFDDPSNISLDEYVFNTEAHPFKAPRRRRRTGAARWIPPRIAYLLPVTVLFTAMIVLPWVFTTLLAATGSQASVLTLLSPRFTITSSTATQLRSDLILPGVKPSPPLTLESTDVLKLTFQIIDKDGAKGVQPHQTFLRFYDAVSGEEGIQPVKVTAGGKAKFELNMARPPSSLPPTTNNSLEVSLYLGSFVHAPAKYELFDLVVPASQPPPQHPDEPSFHPLPPIAHTFRPEQKVPPSAVSALFAALVISPWLVLIGLWAQIRPRVPHLFSPHIVPFLATLGAFEALLFWYWVDLKLGQVLLYGGALGLVTALAGKQALATRVNGGKFRDGIIGNSRRCQCCSFYNAKIGTFRAFSYTITTLCRFV